MKWRARSMRCAFGMPAISSGNATLSVTVRHGKVDSSWNTMPIEACGPVTVSPVTDDAALIAVEQSADDVEQGRLAAAGRADHREEFARRDVERDVVDRGDDAVGRLEAFHDVVDHEHRLCRRCVRNDRSASVAAGITFSPRSTRPRSWPACSPARPARRRPRLRRAPPRRWPRRKWLSACRPPQSDRRPTAPCARASAARSISGSLMRWPIHLFSTGRFRMRATRSWCTSSL